MNKYFYAAVAMALPIVAQGAHPELCGISGRVMDADHVSLPAAVVSVDNGVYAVMTDVDGFFHIKGLEPGKHFLKVTYLGYAPVINDFNVAPGEEASFTLMMNNDAKLLNEVVVEGVFGDQARAINTQKGNVNITNVVSADQIGKFPDSNVGDALKRISGINVQYDQGEARFGQVRGTPAEFSSVTINGNRVPSAEGATRNVQLDLIPSDMVQTIEVSKTLTPDQDGDAIGGSINLVTKLSPNRRVINATAASGYNPVSGKAQLNLGFTYGDRFLNDRLGVMLSASYNNAPRGSYDTEFVWEKTDDGKVYINDYQIRKYYVTRERQSYSLSLDWRFDKWNKVWFKGIYNNRNDWENRYRTTLKDLDEKGQATVRVQTKAGTPDNRDARLERQQTMDFTLGGENRAGIFEIDWKASYARASEDRPNERYLDMQLKKQKFDVDITDPRNPLATPLEGSTMTLNDNFSLKALTQQQQEIAEEDFKANVDLQTVASDHVKIKFGGKVVMKTKHKDVDFYNYTPKDKTGFLAEALGNITDQRTSRFMPLAAYGEQGGLFVDKAFVGSLNLDDASLFDKAQVAEELAGDYRAREIVSSVYGRLDGHLRDNLNLVAGLRVERTDINYTGRRYDDQTDQVSKTDPSKGSYVNFLPSMLVKWEPQHDWVVRLGYNQSISRPKYAALVPGISIKSSDNQATIGNPELKATTSSNFDVSTEYYWQSVGLCGASLFFKQIQGFITDEVRYNAEYAGNTWTRLIQPKNAGNANVAGCELSYQRDFSFIMPVLRCLGFYGTYTYTHSAVTDFNIEGRENEKNLSLPGSPTHTANASLFFDKWGFNVRLSYNYASAFIDELGAESFYDRYYDAVNYLDLNASYTFGKRVKCTLFADCTNMLNQPLRYYQGEKNRTMQQEYYGVQLNGGLKIQF